MELVQQLGSNMQISNNQPSQSQDTIKPSTIQSNNAKPELLEDNASLNPDIVDENSWQIITAG